MNKKAGNFSEYANASCNCCCNVLMNNSNHGSPNINVQGKQKILVLQQKTSFGRASASGTVGIGNQMW